MVPFGAWISGSKVQRLNHFGVFPQSQYQTKLVGSNGNSYALRFIFNP